MVNLQNGKVVLHLPKENVIAKHTQVMTMQVRYFYHTCDWSVFFKLKTRSLFKENLGIYDNLWLEGWSVVREKSMKK